MGTLIRNGTVVTADRTFPADVLIEGSTITEVQAGITPSTSHSIVDATGMFVLPGGIDAHTHLDMPFGGTTSSDDFETGTRAAAIGGTTTIVDFAIQAKGGFKFPIAFFPSFMVPLAALWWGPAFGALTALVGSLVPAWSARTVRVSEVFSKIA